MYQIAKNALFHPFLLNAVSIVWNRELCEVELECSLQKQENSIENLVFGCKDGSEVKEQGARSQSFN